MCLHSISLGAVATIYSVSRRNLGGQSYGHGPCKRMSTSIGEVMAQDRDTYPPSSPSELSLVLWLQHAPKHPCPILRHRPEHWSHLRGQTH